MRFVYGLQEFKTLERGQENCYLLTNGLGGFSSATAVGSASRNDHALLMACLRAPNLRYNIIHRLSERLVAADREVAVHTGCDDTGFGHTGFGHTGCDDTDFGHTGFDHTGCDDTGFDDTGCDHTGSSHTSSGFSGSSHTGYWISSQEFADRRAPEDGYTHLSGFSFEDCPQWIYHVAGVEIVKEIAIKQGENTVAIRYEIDNSSRMGYIFSVTPFMQFTRKGEDLTEKQLFTFDGNRITSEGMRLFLNTNGNVSDLPLTYETYYYAYDACDGRREHGMAAANHTVKTEVPAGGKTVLEIVYSMEDRYEREWEVASKTVEGIAASIIREAGEYRKSLADSSGFHSPLARTLAKSAAQFIAKRESTGGDTILAGYPFFEDWGRDTMIALPGCCLAVRRFETAKSILRTFAKAERKGLLPNLFPEGGREPMYNTVDAALLFINAVYLYYGYTKDAEFVKECYPVMENIIKYYREGTDFAIHMDSDGLIMAGEGFDQVTWMDVRVGEILPTPRHGKPVEVNAYWYNALKIMEEFASLVGEMENVSCKDGTRNHYGLLAEEVKQSFQEKFWLEESRCLKDVVSGTKADNQIRCNQIWAVSMPYSMLTMEQARAVTDTVYEKLYTPYGLRTLACEDGQFKPHYGGCQLERDLAYHQGTVWVFPLGAYYLAYLKVHGYDEESRRTVERQLRMLEGALREGCAGQLPEIYDGLRPVSSKGCFAQAWSVGEILRVLEALERFDGTAIDNR